MPRPFLEVFPREIRDLIYTFILASPSGQVSLSPWTVEVAQSLSILQTCTQIQRECKDVIWYHKGLQLHDPTSLYSRLKALSKHRYIRQKRQLKLSLELLDRDELEWMKRSLPALLEWREHGRLESITLSAIWEKPSSVPEFKEILNLRKDGEPMDGRLFLQQPSLRSPTLMMNTGWPRFSHWGKQRWLREILLDPSGIDVLLYDIHKIFGGQLYVDGVLCFEDGARSARATRLDPRTAEIKILLSLKEAGAAAIRGSLSSISLKRKKEGRLRAFGPTGEAIIPSEEEVQQIIPRVIEELDMGNYLRNSVGRNP